MSHKKKFYFLVLLVLLILSIFYVALSKGAVSIEFSSLWQATFQFDQANQSQLIIRAIRLPRVLGAFLVGSCFALSGALMQGLTRNPLADSGLLGINGGASLAMAISFAVWPKAPAFSVFMISLSGSLAATFFIFGFLHFSKIGMNPIQLILAGVAISSFYLSRSLSCNGCFTSGASIIYWFDDPANRSRCDWIGLLICVTCFFFSWWGISDVSRFSCSDSESTI